MIIKRYLSLLLLLIVAGCASQHGQSNYLAERSSTNNAVMSKVDYRLGTQWGEGLQDSAQKIDLRRIDQSPISTIEISYSAAPLQGTTVKEVMIANGRIGFSILNENGQTMPLKQQGSKIHLQGKAGERYQLFYYNYNKNQIYEVITTVDGLDVINGTAGSFKNSGYVLYPERTLTIAGFRKSNNEVAAFRFSKANDTYAANTEAGDVRNIGVIGTAIFRLVDPKRPVQNTYRPKPNAFPNEKGYAPAPRYSH